jgi:hypothetical protein
MIALDMDLKEFDEQVRLVDQALYLSAAFLHAQFANLPSGTADRHCLACRSRLLPNGRITDEGEPCFHATFGYAASH